VKILAVKGLIEALKKLFKGLMPKIQKQVTTAKIQISKLKRDHKLIIAYFAINVAIFLLRPASILNQS